MQRIYNELMSLQGVTEVEILDDYQGTVGVYVEGGQDSHVVDVIARYTYAWSTTLGDTSTLLYGAFTLRFYRSKQAFRAKFKELFGQEFDQCSLS